MRRAAGLQSFSYGRPYLDNWDVERAVRDGYERVIWVYRCVDVIASNIAGLDFTIRKGHRDKGEEQPRHPLLPVLNQQVNPFETHEAFMYRLVSQYLLAKRGAFVEVQYDRAGNVRQLFLLPPHLTNPIPDPDDFVSGFEVRIGGLTTVTVPAKDENGRPRVLWIRKPHPLDPYSGVTPLESAGLSVDTDYYARLYNRKFLANDGRPGGILAVKGDLDDDDQQELQRRFNGGPDRAGRTSVISAEDATFVDLSINHRDAQYIESMAGTKNDILLAFGTPESVMGNASGRTFDNADAEKAVFWQETLMPHLRLIAGWLDPLDLSTDNFVAFDLSTVTVLLRHQQALENHLGTHVDAGRLSIDEWRDATGRDGWGQPQARALWKNTTGFIAIPLPGDEEAPELQPPPPPGAMSPDGTPLRVGANGKALEPQPDEDAIAQRQAQQMAMSQPPQQQLGGRRPAGNRDQAALGRGGARPAQPSTAAPWDPASAVKGLEFGEIKALDQVQAGTMVAFYPSPQTARRLALEDAEAPEDLHVTLAYLGKNPIDRERLERVVAQFAAGMPPIEATVSGYGRFNLGNGEHAVYASIDAPLIPEWRAQLVATLEANGFEVAAQHGFTPHCTLAYVSADAPDPEMPPRIELTFGKVTVASGPQRQSFRLQAGEQKALPTAPQERLVPAGRFVLDDDADEMQVGQLSEALRAAGFRPVP